MGGQQDEPDLDRRVILAGLASVCVTCPAPVPAAQAAGNPGRDAFLATSRITGPRQGSELRLGPRGARRL